MAETIEGLKERRAWLLKQVEVTDRALEKLLSKANPPRPVRPVPQELPGVPPAPPSPPREKSRQLLAYDFFDQRRRKRMGELYAPEAKLPSAVWITVVFTAIFKEVDESERVVELIDLYFAEEWPGKLTEPFCFAAFAKHWREKWLPKLAVAA